MLGQWLRLSNRFMKVEILAFKFKWKISCMQICRLANKTCSIASTSNATLTNQHSRPLPMHPQIKDLDSLMLVTQINSKENHPADFGILKVSNSIPHMSTDSSRAGLGLDMNSTVHSQSQPKLTNADGMIRTLRNQLVCLEGNT